jgi:hypothetical protein
MDFGKALQNLKEGNKVCREGWNGKGMFLKLNPVCQEETSTLPYLVMFTACKNYVPWLASQTDILAEDWLVLTD